LPRRSAFGPQAEWHLKRALPISGVIWLTVKILAARETSALGRDDD
jgi:hypothetical protein